MSDMSDRILRVNHAGEHGAIQIYRAQLTISYYLYKEAVPKLQEMLGHEKAHLKVFADLMGKRGVRPCYALGLWAVGGYLLGLVTALLGRNAIWACTDAIESSVLEHLDWQKKYLEGQDSELQQAVTSIVAEEEDHRDYGRSLHRGGPIGTLVSLIAKYSTRLAIWLSERL